MVGEGFPIILILRSGLRACEPTAAAVGPVTLRSQPATSYEPGHRIHLPARRGFRGRADRLCHRNGVGGQLSGAAGRRPGSVAANVTNTVSVVAVGIGSTTKAGKALFDGDGGGRNWASSHR